MQPSRECGSVVAGSAPPRWSSLPVNRGELLSSGHPNPTVPARSSFRPSESGKNFRWERQPSSTCHRSRMADSASPAGWECTVACSSFRPPLRKNRRSSNQAPDAPSPPSVDPAHPSSLHLPGGSRELVDRCRPPCSIDAPISGSALGQSGTNPLTPWHQEDSERGVKSIVALRRKYLVILLE